VFPLFATGGKFAWIPVANATSVIDTSGKVAASVVNNGRKFSAVINDTVCMERRCLLLLAHLIVLVAAGIELSRLPSLCTSTY
jgi:hypothetical protein